VKATFSNNGKPAVVENHFGKGRTVYFACTPGISYVKDAHFVATALAEKWPKERRQMLTHFASEADAPPLVRLSEPIVEAGVYEAPTGTVLVLANFTYKPIAVLKVELATRSEVQAVRSLEHGALKFDMVPALSAWRDQGFKYIQRFELPLGDDDL